MRSDSFTKGYWGSRRRQANRALNNILVTRELALQGFARVREDLSTTKRRAFDVTVLGSEGREIRTTRRKKYIRALLDVTQERSLHAEGVVSSISVVEDFLGELLRAVLIQYPQKVKAFRKTIPVDLMLSAGSLDELQGLIVDGCISELFFRTPADYLAVVQDTLAVELPSHLVKTYIEVKATRDVILHNRGIANPIYTSKAGSLARGPEGQPLPVDHRYLRHSVGICREVVSLLGTQAAEKYSA